MSDPTLGPLVPADEIRVLGVIDPLKIETAAAIAFPMRGDDDVDQLVTFHRQDSLRIDLTSERSELESSTKGLGSRTRRTLGIGPFAGDCVLQSKPRQGTRVLVATFRTTLFDKHETTRAA